MGRDILAGVTLAALGIPEVMGYTKIIGTPVITGLYTLLLPVLVFAVFGSSRHLVVSADSATAALVAAALASQGLAAYSPDYVALTGLVALVAGGLLLLARLFRLGFLADFLSRTVLVGFLSGVGIQVAFGELHGMLGLPKDGHGFLGQLLHTLERLPATHGASLLISLGVLAVIVGGSLMAPRFPAALLAVAGAIAASAFFDWGGRGVAIIGDVPSGLPRLGLPAVSWSDVRLVLPIAGSCLIVILAQSAATSRAYALQYRDRFDQNLDLVGLGLANVAAGCSGTFVVNGSPTKSAMVDSAGGRSQISHLTTAAVVLLVLLFLTRPLSFLPNPVLSSIVFLIGIKLIDHRGLMDIHRKAPREFALALVTALTVVVAGVEEGILLALVLSLLQHLRHSYQPHVAIVQRDPRDHWRFESAEPGRMIEPGLVMFWFGSDLFFANIPLFTQNMRRLVDESPSPVIWLVVDAGAITSIDYSAARAVLELRQDLAKAGVVLCVTRINRQRLGNFDRLGLAEAIGEDHIFASRRQCIEAYLRAVGEPPRSGPRP